MLCSNIVVLVFLPLNVQQTPTGEGHAVTMAFMEPCNALGKSVALAQAGLGRSTKYRMKMPN
jgi:hypothetical protein